MSSEVKSLTKETPLKRHEAGPGKSVTGREHRHVNHDSRGYDRNPLRDPAVQQREGASRLVVQERGGENPPLIARRGFLGQRDNAFAPQGTVQVVNRTQPQHADVAG